jgi:hypothetical protein
MAKNSKNVLESVESVKAVVCPNAEAVASVLAQYPHVHTIHVNKEGEWSFMPRPAFIAYTREEILNG